MSPSPAPSLDEVLAKLKASIDPDYVREAMKQTGCSELHAVAALEELALNFDFVEAGGGERPDDVEMRWRVAERIVAAAKWERRAILAGEFYRAHALAELATQSGNHAGYASAIGAMVAIAEVLK